MTRKFDIRPTTLADLAELDALLARSYPKQLKAAYPASVLVTALPMISRAQPDLLKCGTYYAVVTEGAIVGAGGWTRDRTDHRRGHIRHVVTDDRRTGLGVGRALLEHCFETARVAGIVQMECWSTLNAEGFYQALGFRTLGPMDVMLAAGINFPSLRMERDL